MYLLTTEAFDINTDELVQSVPAKFDSLKDLYRWFDGLVTQFMMDGHTVFLYGDEMYAHIYTPKHKIVMVISKTHA